MKEKGAGWIPNIASIESTTPYPSAPAYATSKWGLRGWSKSCFMVPLSLLVTFFTACGA